MAYEAPQLRKSLTKTGLSMSQAQTVSNLAFQNAYGITNDMSMYNNASKTIAYKGKDHTQVEGHSIPADIDALLDKIGGYHAVQAFLMENIKCKEAWLQELRTADFEPSEQLVKESPESPVMVKPKLERPIGEEWAWAKLTKGEMAEYWEKEAQAAHLGQFIHKGGKLDMLRKQLPTIQSLEWFVTGGVNGESLPITVIVHHKTAQLTEMHNRLANKHKELEQKVNYFKAKVKNLVTEENARRAEENGKEQARANQENNKLIGEYQKLCVAYEGKRRVEEEAFERKRNEDIKYVAALRIEVDSRFQAVIDELMPNKEEEGEDKKSSEVKRS